MAKKGLFGKRKSTAAAAAQRMVLGGLPQEEEELMQSPARMVLQSFVHDKVAMTGLILFLIIFLCCIILPFFYPIQLSYQDVTQSNVAPGFGMLSVPSQLQGNAQMVSSGSTFSVGIDKDGNVYEWGTFPTEKLKNIPSSSEMGKLTQISAGLDHVLAVNEEGQLFTWGNDRMGLNILPVELQASPQPIKQISAGYQISLALTESGRLYNWGSAYLLNVSVPSEVQGNIAKFDDNTNIVMALTNDGEVVPLSTTTSVFTNIPEEIQGNVVDIALTDESAAALTNDGQVHVWGNNVKGTLNLPEEIQGHVTAISAGRYHYTVILDDGSVVTWGDNNFGQTKVPNFNGTVDDVEVLTHEAGHAFAAYRARNLRYLENMTPTMESAEVHSMSMELFSRPWDEGFFGEGAALTAENFHLQEACLFAAAFLILRWKKTDPILVMVLCGAAEILLCT